MLRKPTTPSVSTPLTAPIARQPKHRIVRPARNPWRHSPIGVATPNCRSPLRPSQRGDVGTSAVLHPCKRVLRSTGCTSQHGSSSCPIGTSGNVATMQKDRFSIDALGWGTVSGIVASLSLLISVTYDWGFFFALDLSYAKAPTTIVDHIQSWLYWLPALMPVGFGVFLAHLAPIENPVRNLDQNSTRTEIVHALNVLRKKQKTLILTIIITAVILVLSSYFLFDSIYPLGLYGLVPIWFLWFTRKRDKFPAALREILTWFPPLLVFAFLSGSVHAGRALGHEFRSTHRLVTFYDGESQQDLDVNVLRTFQDWLLVVDDDDQMAWISSQSIKRMEILERPAAKENQE